MSIPRWLASRGMNAVFGRGLSLPVTDLSSPFQLYRADVLREQRLSAHDYDLRPEILVRALAGGWYVCEIPLRVDLSRRDRSLTPLVRLGARYARTFGALWKLRNSIQAGDYDARAHDSTHSAAALLAAAAIQAHHRTDGGSGAGPGRWLWIEQDHRRPAARQRRARRAAEQAALRAAIPKAARARLQASRCRSRTPRFHAWCALK